MGAPVVMIGAPDMMGAAAAAEEVMMGTPVVVAGVYALMPPVVMMGVAVVDGTVMIGAAVSIVTLGRMCETVGSFKTLRNAAESTNCEGMMSKQMCLKCRFKQAFKQLYQCKYPLLT